MAATIASPPAPGTVSRSRKMMRDHARADLATPDLLELLSLDDAAFKERFRGTPILRTKRRGLLRNVCVALAIVVTPMPCPPSPAQP